MATVARAVKKAVFTNFRAERFLLDSVRAYVKGKGKAIPVQDWTEP